MDDARDVDDGLPRIHGAIPGARTAELVPALRGTESRNVTYLAEDFPVFWERASGATVTDVDGNRYVDLTSAFGVANVGHGNARVVAAIRDQAERLLHGMGDVHPTEVRTRLLARLHAVVPSDLSKTFLATTGSEAVEAAMKTAMLATGNHRFVAYRGAYHGLSLGTLAVSGIPKFARPFRESLGPAATLVPYPDAAHTDTASALTTFEETIGSADDIAAVIVEPIQGRGGCIVPPPGYLAGVRRFCSEHGIVLIFDEIYTGFGRTGAWFACEDEDVTPDILCVGKAMGGGVPISAAIARAAIMDAWPPSSGEALHTSTYLGNPLGCAAALGVIDELERSGLPARARALEPFVRERLEPLRARGAARAIRGRGLMWGVALGDAAAAERAVKGLLTRGVIALQAGPEGDVLSITPPLVISESQLSFALDALNEVL